MRITAVALSAFLLVSLCGCTASVSAGVKLPVKVEVEGLKSCPPGQAKKGNC